MFITDGNLIIENITISIKDNLTTFLQKTLTLDKEIENINNFYHIYINNIHLYGILVDFRITYNQLGIFCCINISIVNNEYNEDLYLSFFNTLCNTKNKCKTAKFGIIAQNEYKWGTVGIYKDRFFGDVSISINSLAK